MQQNDGLALQGHRRFFFQCIECLVKCKDFLLLTAKTADRHGPCFGLALPDHYDNRDFGERMLPHFIIDLFIAQIGFDTQPGRLAGTGDLLGVFIALGRNRRNHNLNRRQP